MTDLINKLKALDEKATKGPWRVSEDTRGHIKSFWLGHRKCGGVGIGASIFTRR